MSEELSITHERVDDIPVLLAQLEKMQVAPLLDAHFPTHGNWQGLSLGQVASGWLTFILSEANHRLSHRRAVGRGAADDPGGKRGESRAGARLQR